MGLPTGEKNLYKNALKQPTEQAHCRKYQISLHVRPISEINQRRGGLTYFIGQLIYLKQEERHKVLEYMGGELSTTS